MRLHGRKDGVSVECRSDGLNGCEVELTSGVDDRTKNHARLAGGFAHMVRLGSDGYILVAGAGSGLYRLVRAERLRVRKSER